MLLLSPKQTIHHTNQAVRSGKGIKSCCRFMQVEVTVKTPTSSGRFKFYLGETCFSENTVHPLIHRHGFCVDGIHSNLATALHADPRQEKKGYCIGVNVNICPRRITPCYFLASNWIPSCLPGISTALINPTAAKK